MDAYETALRSEINAYGIRMADIRVEIAALTLRREELERALSIYGQSMPARHKQNSSLGRAGSQTAFVLEAIRDSGSAGLTTTDIYKKTAEAGLTIQQATIRSLLYGRKKDGILERLFDGRYRFPQAGSHPSNSEVPAAETAGTSNES